MDLSNYYKKISLAAARAYCSGIQKSVGGNLSMRIPGEMIIAKSKGGSFADCTEDGAGFVLTDMNGNALDYVEAPTKEIYLHTLLYKTTGCGAVVHCHSPWAVAWSMNNELLPALTLQVQLKLKSDIPILPVKTPVVTKQSAGMIEKIFEDDPKLQAFILAGHGVVTIGADPLLAEQVAELVEETAKIACINKMLK